MKIDKLDSKILYYLHYDARIPLSKLAQHIGISKQNLHYRLKKLIDNKVILGFMSVIDIHHLGYLTYRIYFRFKNVDEKKEQEIISYFKHSDTTLWIVSLLGPWDMEVVVTARNFIHFNNIFKKMKDDLGAYFSKYNVSSSIVNYHFKRDYLLNKKREEFTPRYYGFEPQQERLNALDVDIMIQLSENCRQNNQEIAKKLGVTYHTIKNRIQMMEQKKIIQGHRITIDMDKIGRKYYKALLTLKNPGREEERKLYAFCSQYHFVTYLVEVLGDWQLEVETEVESQEQFMEFLRNLRNNFSELILDYDVLQLTREHYLNYFPVGRKIFETAAIEG